jgi:dihydroorotate dehydrogenase
MVYKALIRPLFFLLPPEQAHRLVAFLLGAGMRIPGMSRLLKQVYCTHHPSLAREVFGIRFPNPVGMAAGFDKEAALYNHLAPFGFSHVEVGTVTPLPQPGNPKPRLFRLPKDQALINRMGFNNHGIEAFVRRLKANKPGIIVGGNIGKNTATPHEESANDYCRCFRELFDLVDYFTVNVSCPNITGLSRLQDKDELVRLLQAIQEINFSHEKPKPVLLKISPDLTNAQLDEVLEVVNITKLNGIIATNTSRLRDGVTSPEKVVERAGMGGLSGKPLKRKSTETITYLHKTSAGKLPIIASGGVITPEDAIEKLRAGASLVQIYTGFIYEGPSLVKRINQKILEMI